MEPKRQKLDLEIVDEINGDACSINDLPNEIIEKIFSYLTQNELGQIARVCEKWGLLTKNPVLWKKVNVKIFCPSDGKEDAQFFNTFIDGLPSCVTFIRLKFSQSHDPGFYKYLDFGELCMKLHHTCPHAEVLILERCFISQHLPKVINNCTQFLQGLKKLVLHECLFDDYSETEELKDNSKIKVLDLRSSVLSSSDKIQFSKLLSLNELRLAATGVPDTWFVGDTSFLNQLQVLDLGWTWVNASTVLTIQRHGQNLKELHLCYLDLCDGDLNFNPMFPHLQTLCLRDTRRVTCEAVVSLVRSCPSLVSVYVGEDVAEDFAEHPFVVANRCKSGIVKIIDRYHNHNVDYLHN